MIKMVRAWVDSEGGFHTTRDAACKAEFKRLLLASFMAPMTMAEVHADTGIKIDVLVEGMFELDRIFGEATKEDRRFEPAPQPGEADAS